jgi:hypothetical protein
MPNTGLSAGQIRQMFMDFFIQKVRGGISKKF